MEARPHWSKLGWAPWAFAASVGALVATVVVWPGAPIAVGWVLLGLVAVAALWSAGRWLRWRSTVLVVTTSRLVQRSGMLARRGVEVRLERINEVSYEQSILERLMGTGRLYLDMGGGRGLVGFDHVRRPARLAALLQDRAGHVDAGARRRPDAGWSSGWPHDTPPSGMPGPHPHR